ncbi:kinesin-like protein [Elysia marginata]|uniref:Kinesin-like protein n=1 Tax=Elysia marginata TaxID=1093978 RepID=A0AAV4I176_9GAST|nr:kinesin-like protein [Elysia marginata]
MIGFNGTLFAYGQSGSGKTYTIDAMRTYVIEAIYDHIRNCPSREFILRVAYMELYNEHLSDLLTNKPLHLRETTDRNLFIEGLDEEIVLSQDHFHQILKKGNDNRTFAATSQNDHSSRAHCIFQIAIESRVREDGEDSSVFISQINLVDLAGSEKAGENSGNRFREGCSINLSLLTLSQVIRKLSEGDKNAHINYRDSKLTRLLQNALGGNSRTAILCSVSPSSVEETMSTLRFASNAKRVKNQPKQNEVVPIEAKLKRSLLENERLKKEIEELRRGNLSSLDHLPSVKEGEIESHKERKDLEDLSTQGRDRNVSSRRRGRGISQVSVWINAKYSLYDI